MYRLFFLLALSLAFAGCDSMPSMSERFSPVLPQTRVVEADRHAVFEAAQLALKRIDFVLTKAALAQGIVEGRSGLRTDDPFREVRQYTIEVRFDDLDDRHMEVSVLVREQVEGDLQSGASNHALRTHGLYDEYFAMLDQALREGTAASANHP